MQPNKRLPRVERFETKTVHEDENQHLWAVSYADFLMALLSFFILFFSMDTPQSNNLIHRISGELNGKLHESGQAQGTGGPGTETKVVPGRLPASLLTNLNDFKLDVAKDESEIVIHLPDNLFAPGAYEFSEANRELIQSLLEKLKPYEGQVTLHFEGQADDSPLRHHKTNIVRNNFVLSSLRASNALEEAKSLGFDEKKLFIQASSSNLRNSRSLTLRIQAREVAL